MSVGAFFVFMPLVCKVSSNVYCRTPTWPVLLDGGVAAEHVAHKAWGPILSYLEGIHLTVRQKCDALRFNEKARHYRMYRVPLCASFVTMLLQDLFPFPSYHLLGNPLRRGPTDRFLGTNGLDAMVLLGSRRHGAEKFIPIESDPPPSVPRSIRPVMSC